MKKKNVLLVKLLSLQGFCPLKIKVTQFPDGFCLNISHVCMIIRKISMESLENP